MLETFLPELAAYITPRLPIWHGIRRALAQRMCLWKFETKKSADFPVPTFAEVAIPRAAPVYGSRYKMSGTLLSEWHSFK